MTELVTARTEDELRALAPTGRLLAGGTDLLGQIRAGREVPRLIDVSNLIDGPPLVVRVDGGVRLSALAPLAMVIEALDGLLPSLAAVAELFGSIQIRNRATIGGNLANASPAGDTIPILVAARATAEVCGPAGSRSLPVTELITGPGRTALAPGEWISTVEVPLPAGEEGFRKLGGRRAMAISVVNLAWRWRRGEDGRLHDVALAVGAVAPTVIRAKQAEAELEDERPEPAVVGRAMDAIRAEVAPIDDVRASAWYRREAVGAVLREALAAAGQGDERMARGNTWTSA